MNHTIDNFIGLRLWIPSLNVREANITDCIEFDTYVDVVCNDEVYTLPFVDGAVPEEYATIK